MVSASLIISALLIVGFFAAGGTKFIAPAIMSTKVLSAKLQSGVKDLRDIAK